MIAEVTFEKTTYADLPHKFEAGTPNIEGGIVLGTAIDYMNSIGFENIAAYGFCHPAIVIVDHAILKAMPPRVETAHHIQER